MTDGPYKHRKSRSKQAALVVVLQWAQDEGTKTQTITVPFGAKFRRSGCQSSLVGIRDWADPLEKMKSLGQLSGSG